MHATISGKKQTSWNRTDLDRLLSHLLVAVQNQSIIINQSNQNQSIESPARVSCLHTNHKNHNIFGRRRQCRLCFFCRAKEVGVLLSCSEVLRNARHQTINTQHGEYIFTIKCILILQYILNRYMCVHRSESETASRIYSSKP